MVIGPIPRFRAIIRPYNWRTRESTSKVLIDDSGDDERVIPRSTGDLGIPRGVTQGKDKHDRDQDYPADERTDRQVDAGDRGHDRRDQGNAADEIQPKAA
jgi:hypothetical protein